MTPEQQRAYWRANLRYVALLLAIWLLACAAAVLLDDRLDAITVAGFPLGFWFGQQGAVVVFVLLAFAYVGLMNRLDKKFGVWER